MTEIAVAQKRIPYTGYQRLLRLYTAATAEAQTLANDSTKYCARSQKHAATCMYYTNDLHRNMRIFLKSHS